MVAAYQSPWGWDRRSCVVNQAGPGHRRRLLGSGDIGAVPFFPCLCFLGVDLDLSWVVLVEAPRKVTCFLWVDLGLSWVEVVATRKVTCESYEWSSWGLVVRRSERGSPRPEGLGAVHRSWSSVPEAFYKLAIGA